MALAYAHKEMQPRAIYAGRKWLDLLCMQRSDDGVYYINRFMIDEKHQRKVTEKKR
ncbi:MAG: hypothetical protein R3A12_10500 [Ignavibacteria bacterium]